MAKLSLSQLNFLATQGVPEEKTFDAEGMPRWLYRELMKPDDLWVAYGVVPCRAGGHSLRTRAGSCIQCSTAQLAFLKRWNGTGCIYVATSESMGFTKVGVAVDYSNRVSSLNNVGYGNARDWTIYGAAPSERMGRLEHQVHEDLSNHKIDIWYEREGHLVACKELFLIDPAVAWAAIQRAL